MKPVLVVCRSILSLLAFAVPTSAQGGHVVEVRMPVAPSPVPAEGRIHLVYELHITNMSFNAATLTRVWASEARGGAHLMTLEGEDLAGDLRVVGVRGVPSIDQGVLLPAGGRAILYMWLSLDPGSVPEALTHRISLFQVHPQRDDTTRNEFDTEPLGLGPEPVIISPPLYNGDWWVSSWDGRRQNDTGHRRTSMISVNGRAPTAQRFARDWSSGSGEMDTRGQEVLAVADGVVIEVKDGIPENEGRPTTALAVPITLETLLGNYVLLDIGGERFAVYAHLQPGLSVGVGDRVKTGDLLGLVGNSGNSMGNHLHLQIVDRPSPLGGEGVPYVIDSFEVIGERFGRRDAESNAFRMEEESWDPELREREMPMEGAIVRFRNTGGGKGSVDGSAAPEPSRPIHSTDCSMQGRCP